MSSDYVVRLGPKVTLRLKASSPRATHSDSSYQSSVSACPPVEASRNHKKRSRDARCETDTPAIPSSAISPLRVIVPLKRKITIVRDGKSDVGHSQNNEANASSYGGDSYVSEYLSKDWQMSDPADPSAPVPTKSQPQDDCEMASWLAFYALFNDTGS